MNTPRKSAHHRAGFTLVELLVSVAIISLIMMVLVGMTNQISQVWRSTTGKIEQFQEARDGFDSMTRKLSQATLNTYWDLFYVTSGVKIPKDFVRASQLRFVSGPMARLAANPQRPTHGVFFQAPLGLVDDSSSYGKLDNLLNTWGYFLEVGDEQNLPPFLVGRVPARSRSRLMELMQPAESMSVYDLDAKGSATPVAGDQLRWFKPALTGASRPVRVLAENIVALIVWPKLSQQQEDARRIAGKSVLSPSYLYDSSVLSFKSTRFGTAQLPIFLNEGAKLINSNDPVEAAEISPKHQLPPIVQVTMVALDEVSAQRLTAKSGNNATIDLVKGLFTESCAFGTGVNAKTQYEKDLETLENNLVAAKLSYRIFSSNVTIRGAKWSAAQTR